MTSGLGCRKINGKPSCDSGEIMQVTVMENVIKKTQPSVTNQHILDVNLTEFPGDTHINTHVHTVLEFTLETHKTHKKMDSRMNVSHFG